MSSLLDEYDIDDPKFDIGQAARELAGQLGKAGEELATAKRGLTQLTIEFAQWQAVTYADCMLAHPKYPQWKVENHVTGQPRWRQFNEAIADAKQQVANATAVEKAIEYKAKFVLALFEHE